MIMQRHDSVPVVGVPTTPLPCATRVLQARREEEARKAAEAEVKGAAGYAAASADVRGLHT